jgi:hypothetical protein
VRSDAASYLRQNWGRYAARPHAVANFYNPTGIDHCSPEQFAEIVKDKEMIMKETGAIDVFLNPMLLASWFGPFRRFNLAHPGTLKVKRIEFRSAGA